MVDDHTICIYHSIERKKAKHNEGARSCCGRCWVLENLKVHAPHILTLFVPIAVETLGVFVPIVVVTSG